MNDPTSAAEWQAAVDAADFFLLIDSARAYGMIVYDGDIHVDRCLGMLRKGAERGVLPRRSERRRALIAEYVRRARVQLGITQGALADRLGYSHAWLSRVESGRRPLDDAAWQRLHAAIQAIAHEAADAEHVYAATETPRMPG